MQWFSYFFIFLITILSIATRAQAFPPSSIDLENVKLADAIRYIAKTTHHVVIISPRVQGYITLHLEESNLEKTLDLLLMANKLARWRVGKIWYVDLQEELIKRKQEQEKWRDASENAAPLLTKLWQINYAKAEDMARLLQDEHYSLLSKRGHVRVDTRTNILCVQDNAERIAQMHMLIQRVDVPVKQILIEARLASVDSDYERELGIQFITQAAMSGGMPSTASLAYPEVNSGQYSVTLARLANGSQLDMRLSALEQAGHAKLISSPSLFTANQQPASIEAGEEIPYQEISRSGATAVVFKKAALRLQVVPQIMPGNKVLLRLQVNQDKPSSRMILGVPTISTRRITTSVLVRNAQTLVLGGIYESNSEQGEEKFPFFSQIPLLGLLFQQHNTRESKRELLVFVTPKIIAMSG